MLCDTAKYPFAEPRAAIGPSHHDAGTDIGRDAVELEHRIAAAFGHLRARRDAMMRQPADNVLNLMLHRRLATLLLGNTSHGNLLGLAEQRQRIGNGAPRFRAVFPGHQRTAQVQP